VFPQIRLAGRDGGFEIRHDRHRPGDPLRIERQGRQPIAQGDTRIGHADGVCRRWGTKRRQNRRCEHTDQPLPQNPLNHETMVAPANTPNQRKTKL
jgi:hypothetical protein